MSRNWAPACAGVTMLLLLASCATRPPSPDAFTFAVLGDLAYTPRQEAMFVETMRRIDAESPAFTVHVGDFKGSGPCSDELFALRRAQLDASAVPLVFVPGDNEWTDCRASRNGSMDPIERLARLRTLFFAGGESLGLRRMATAAQDRCLAAPPAGCGCAAHPENRLWRHQRVQFVTLNIPGHQNNIGHDERNDREALCRNAANAAWLERAASESESEAVRALVVIAHANPWYVPARHRHAFDGFLAQMRSLPPRLRKPILFVHGDTHSYRITEFLDEKGQAVDGITRLETHGSPFIGYVLVSVEPGSSQPFGFTARLVALFRG